MENVGTERPAFSNKGENIASVILKRTLDTLTTFVSSLYVIFLSAKTQDRLA